MPRQSRRLNDLTAKPIGDWNGAIKFFSRMGIEIKKKAVEAQWQSVKKLKQIVIGHLLAQDLNWGKLAPSTVKNKRENKGYVLIDTETYLNAIKVWKVGNTSFIGVKKGTMYKRKTGNVNLERVAIWLEYGTRKMPARPLWGPSIDEMGGKKGMRDFVADAIYRRLKWLARGKPIKVMPRSKIAKLMK